MNVKCPFAGIVLSGFASTSAHMPRLMYVYILANRRGTVLYVGVTNNIARRMAQHRAGKAEAFTARYSCTRLVYWEVVHGQWQAIAREKQIKAGPRSRKIRLIESLNPAWQDLLPAV